MTKREEIIEYLESAGFSYVQRKGPGFFDHDEKETLFYERPCVPGRRLKEEIRLFFNPELERINVAFSNNIPIAMRDEIYEIINKELVIENAVDSNNPS